MKYLYLRTIQWINQRHRHRVEAFASCRAWYWCEDIDTGSADTNRASRIIALEIAETLDEAPSFLAPRRKAASDRSNGLGVTY